MARDSVYAKPHSNMDNIGPAGSIISNARDMAQWLRFQLGDGVYNGKRLVSSAALRETHTPLLRAGTPRREDGDETRQQDVERDRGHDEESDRLDVRTDAAILGSLSGLFYVVQMMGYNGTLAMVAMALTFTYVSINMIAKYLQLRYQRQEIQYRGAIAGLVLNLISGVSKLRIAGAENHAFKVWAREFAQQRKISFTVGNIQNVAGVFGACFPVLSSIAIFSVMMSEQAKAAESGEKALTVGAFIAFNAAYGLFLGAMQALGDASLNLMRIIPIYERIIPILETPPEVDRTKGFPGRLSGATPRTGRPSSATCRSRSRPASSSPSSDRRGAASRR